MSKSKIFSGVGIVLGAAVLLFSTTLFGVLGGCIIIGVSIGDLYRDRKN
jgi:hypothetical protein